MHATSADQFAAAQSDAASGDGIPALEEVRPGLWAMGVPFPGVLPHFTLSYLVLDDTAGVHILDPGWDSDHNWSALEAALTDLGRGVDDIATVTVTHLHPDHLGMAARVRAASGATVALHRLEQDAIHELASPIPDAVSLARFLAWGAPDDRHPELLDAVRHRSAWPSFTADRLLEDGDTLNIAGRELRVLHTPGHTTGHIALHDANEKLLFTGDLLLPNQFPGVGLGGSGSSNPLDDYQASLGRITELDDHEVLPGHGFRFTGLAERCAETAGHQGRRTAEVTAILDSGTDPSVWQLASELSWTAGWENLQGLQLLSALAQTELHLRRAHAHPRVSIRAPRYSTDGPLAG